MSSGEIEASSTEDTQSQEVTFTKAMGMRSMVAVDEFTLCPGEL